MRDQRDLSVDFRVSGAPYQIAKDVELAIYRIVQEALQNAVRHAEASAFAVSVAFQRDSLRVTISDDGKGFDPAQVKQGLGLVGIRERADAMKARLSIDTVAGGGTRIILELARTWQKMEKVDADPGLVG
jgi:two-component system sensor histidine kinase DegS